MWQSKR
jgi:hypothetical protein